MRKIQEKDILHAFWSKVNILSKDECWEWKEGLYTNGYGRFYLHRVATPAHRFAWESINGKIPDGLEACHKCDNKKCVNPSHIFLGTHKENMYDAIAKGIIKNPPINKGKDNKSSKLDEEKVKEIFRLFNSGYSKSYLGKKFGVTKQAIGLVLNRTNWAYVVIS